MRKEKRDESLFVNNLYTHTHTIDSAIEQMFPPPAPPVSLHRSTNPPVHFFNHGKQSYQLI